MNQAYCLSWAARCDAHARDETIPAWRDYWEQRAKRWRQLAAEAESSERIARIEALVRAGRS